jgi:predicted MFS family arabinose efflux permease
MLRTRRTAGGSRPEYAATTIAAAGLIALAVAIGIGRFAFTPILPMMQEDAGLTVATAGWLASANYLGYLLGALSAVGLNIRGATAIRMGLALIVITTFAMGLGNNFTVWIVLRTLAGVASAWVLVFVFAWSLARLAHLQRPRLAGITFTGVGAGIAMAGSLCLALMHLRVSSNVAWIAFGALSLTLTVPIWPVFAGNDSRPTEVAVTPEAGKVKWTGDAARLILCYGAFGFGYIIPATFLPAMAKQIIPDPAIFGWSWPVFGAAAAAATLAAHMLQRAFSNRRLWMGSQLAMAIGVILPVCLPGIGATLIAAVLVGATLMLTTMVAVQEGREVGGVHATRLIAAMTAAFAVGQIIGPVGASVTIWLTGSLSMALLVAGFVLVAGIGVIARRSTHAE